MDLDDEENRLFAQIINYRFRTTLIERDPEPERKEHLDVFVENLLGPKAGFGGVFALRDSYLCYNEHLGPTTDERREQMCFQFVGDLEAQQVITEAELDDKLFSFLEKQGVTGARILRHGNAAGAWEYFYHYSQDALDEGALWNIFERQGLRRTLWVHASCCFESVLDLINYNRTLCSKLVEPWVQWAIDTSTSVEMAVAGREMCSSVEEKARLALQVEVVSARGLRDGGMTLGAGKFDPYCVVEIHGKPSSKFHTPIVNFAIDPVWRYQNELLDYMLGDALICSIYHSDPKTSDKFLGKATLSSEQVYPEGLSCEVKLDGAGVGADAYLMLKIIPKSLPVMVTFRDNATVCRFSTKDSILTAFRRGDMSGNSTMNSDQL